MNETVKIAATPECQEPHVIEAEQQVLGALLNVPDAHVMLSREHFYDPCHGDLYRRICEMKEDGQTPSPISLKTWAQEHEGMKELGGAQYLVRLAGASITPSAVAEYASMVRDYKARRDVLTVLREADTAICRDDEDLSGVLARVELAVTSQDVKSKARPVSMMAAVTEAMEASYAAFQGDAGGAVKSGVSRLDNLLGGFYPGEMTLLGGRPSMGKTAVALSIALNAARTGKHIAIASLEMTPAALATRAISEATTYENEWGAVSYSEIRRGNLNARAGEAVKEAAKDVAQLPITFLPSEYQDVGALLGGVRQINRTNPVDMVVIDYAQLLRAKGANRYEEITEISRAIKSMARTMEVPILALSQLSRALEQRSDKRPMLSDLRESGQLEQDADAVIFCYRDQYYLEREEPDDQKKHEAWAQAVERSRNRLELIVAKQRQGAIGTAHVMCNPALNKIWE